MKSAALKRQSIALFARLCRTCGRSESEVPFPRTSAHRCTACVRDREQQRQARILARGLRPTTSPGEDNPAHLKWIRKLPCTIRRLGCSKIIHAHHVRTGGTAGTAMLPPDAWAVPLCATHHHEFHSIGVDTFEALYGVDLRGMAAKLAKLSPHLRPVTGRV